MRSIPTLPAALFLALSLSLSAQEATEKAKRDVAQADRARTEAILRADAGALEKLLADDLTYTHSTGWMESKQQFIESIRTGALKYHAIEPLEAHTRVYGQTGVITGRARFRVSSPRAPGQVQEFELRFTTVYVHQGGAWRQVAWQSTRVTPP